MLFHKLRFHVKFPRTLWMPNPCSHSLPNLTFRICNRKYPNRLFADCVYRNLLIAICMSLNFQSEGFRFRTRKYPELCTVDKFASCRPVWRWSSTAATAWFGHLQLEYGFTSTALANALQVLLTLYSSCLRGYSLWFTDAAAKRNCCVGTWQCRAIRLIPYRRSERTSDYTASQSEEWREIESVQVTQTLYQDGELASRLETSDGGAEYVWWK